MSQKNNPVSRVVARANHLKPFANSEELLGTRLIDLYTSMYLIPIDRTEQEFILIDTGINKQARAVKQELARRNLGLTAIKRIYITHGHSDHSRGRNGLPLHIDTYVGEPDIPVILGHQRSQGHRPRMAELFGIKASVPGLIPIPYQHGVISEIGDLSIVTIDEEGHTSGSSGVIVQNNLTGMVNAHVGDLFTYGGDGLPMNAPENVSHDINKNAESIIDFYNFMIQSGYSDKDTLVAPSHSGHGTLSAIRDYLDID